jgi:hypothetical protein
VLARKTGHLRIDLTGYRLHADAVQIVHHAVGFGVRGLLASEIPDRPDGCALSPVPQQVLSAKLRLTPPLLQEPAGVGSECLLVGVAEQAQPFLPLV